MKKVKIGIVGCGAIGEGVALFVNKELKAKAQIWGIADKDKKRAKNLKKKLKFNPKILEVGDLIRKVDLVVEAASQECARYIFKRALVHRKDVVILSVGALIGELSLLKQAEKRGIKIYVPSGAVSGIDGLGALSLGKIKKVSLVTSKPPQGLIGAEYLKKKKINLVNLKKEKVVFRGTVKEAIKYFPKNINVAATLLLASSFRNIEVCIKADPKVKRNIHRIEIEAKEAKVSISIENVPANLNPKTSTLAILSAQYLLKKIFSSFKIGS
ncbi:MAG: aspartate dehydrogenase [Candidatus Omnitrophica bacterium]|nr:aspartate dehydrogenase [Candidatus Omnitrophota bacterium]MBU1367761.1 aspartate dehydrogenase [Candidatus Omnitrophota bacterium]MBU1810090.1 aspartate dehydrogenase [Candidatus Omnitrophota bacterium]MBU2436154.1 aspartate dehydrogenase [Candidatus Omnitrophota bacterium]MBU2504222.1 aspartate dehydrogenase [Candidatus Omnitrophota bacterium]